MELPEQSEFVDVVDTITNMFGETISRDVVAVIVESFGGDLEQAVEAIMNMTNETDLQNASIQEDTVNSPPQSSSLTENQQSNVPDSQPLISYAKVSQKRATNVTTNISYHSAPPPSNSLWTDQIRRIVEHHNRGSRLLLMMRGASGSGKSYLANQIITITIGCTRKDLKTHIFSTDDYFMQGGIYRFDKFRLQDAHMWNHKRVAMALQQGLSPVIVDNTNLELWEMEPYIRKGIECGYILEVVEPKTPWAKKAHQLVKKSTHSIPIITIKRMLQKYQEGVDSQFLMKFYNLSYSFDMAPPVMRNFPPPPVENIPMISNPIQPSSTSESPNHIIQNINDTNPFETTHVTNQEQFETISSAQTRFSKCEPGSMELQRSDSEKVFKFNEMQDNLQEFHKIEQEWENGESWNEEHQNSSENKSNTCNEPKPERQRLRGGSCSETSVTKNDASTSGEFNMNKNLSQVDDWRQLSMFLTPWENPAPSTSISEITVTAEKKDTGTSIERYDNTAMDPSQSVKIITATPRDINFYYIPAEKEKIPEVRMLDKGTITAEPSITENQIVCPYAEKHFTNYRRHFKSVPIDVLRDIFEKCCGDVNWAYNIILDGQRKNLIPSSDIGENDEMSEDEETESFNCDCFAKYDIIPNVSSRSTDDILRITNNIPEPNNEINKKEKKDKSLSESTIQLKRQIEHNVVISDSYYSQQCLKIRKMRRGEGDNIEEPNNKKANQVCESVDENRPSTSIETSKHKHDCSDDESTASSIEDNEETVNIDIGAHFVSNLDLHCGREDMTYPENVLPKINVPLSLLHEINALWIESIMHQLDENCKQSDLMVKQDEEFARELSRKENELANAGQEPEVPDFQEIMDLDLAISLYNKDIAAEWRKNEPDNLAAKMTREKLYNMFPEISSDILSELLMAHKNNFKGTVESLLMSTGHGNILEEKNGINKFVMQKEIERQAKILEEQKKAISEVDWPLLPQGETVEMSTVDDYRKEAEMHLNRRNLYYQKAQQSIHRGMTQVATYYSEVADFHKKKYEQANSMAAASLMQVHASRTSDNATIDLHYLRVHEARESLDLFLDTHITKLKESQNTRAPKYHKLFFITGRGRHSVAGPKVKPAVKKRLRERGIPFTERNPGLLASRVSANDKLTHEIP